MSFKSSLSHHFTPRCSLARGNDNLRVLYTLATEWLICKTAGSRVDYSCVVSEWLNECVWFGLVRRACDIAWVVRVNLRTSDVWSFIVFSHQRCRVHRLPPTTARHVARLDTSCANCGSPLLFVLWKQLEVKKYKCSPIRTLGQELIPVSIGSQPTGDLDINPAVSYTITFLQAHGYLPSRRASTSFTQYQIILFGDCHCLDSTELEAEGTN